MSDKRERPTALSNAQFVLAEDRPIAGSVMMEFALIIPFFAIIIFGIIQWGLIFYQHINLKQASAIAARASILDGSTIVGSCNDAAFETAVENRLIAALTSSPHVPTRANIQVSCIDIDPNPAFTENATNVQISYDMPLLFSFVVPNANANGTLTLNMTTIMR